MIFFMCHYVALFFCNSGYKPKILQVTIMVRTLDESRFHELAHSPHSFISLFKIVFG